MNRLRLFGVLGALLVPLGAEAVPMTFDFAGTATSASGIWAGQGTAVTGSFTYEASAIDSNGANTTLNRFQSSLFGNDAIVTWSLSFTLGGTTRTIVSSGRTLSLISLDRGGGGDDIYYFGTGGALLFLRGGDPNAVVNTDNFAPLGAPNLDLFSLALGMYKVEGLDNLLRFRLISMTPAGIIPVPEPLTLALLGMGLAVAGLARKVGRKRR